MASDDQATRKESELNQLLDEIRRRAEEAELKRIEEIERKVSGLRTSSALPSPQAFPPSVAPSGNEQKILELREKPAVGTERKSPDQPANLFRDLQQKSLRDSESEILRSKLGASQPEGQRSNAKLFPMHPPLEEKRAPTESQVRPESDSPATPVAGIRVESQEVLPPKKVGVEGSKIVEPRKEEAAPVARAGQGASPPAAPTAQDVRLAPRALTAPKERPPVEQPEAPSSHLLLWVVLVFLVVAVGGYVFKTLVFDARATRQPTVNADLPGETGVNPAVNNPPPNDVKAASNGDQVKHEVYTSTPAVSVPKPAAPEGGQVQFTKPIVRAPVAVPEQRPRPTKARTDQADAPIVLPKEDKPKDQPVAAITQKEMPNSDDQPPPDFVAVAKEPVLIKRVEPKYPDVAMKLGLQGRVVVRIWVDKEGKPRQVIIMKSDNDIFNQPAIEAAKQFIFTPGYVSTGPVATWVAVPFKFTISSKR